MVEKTWTEIFENKSHFKLKKKIYYLLNASYFTTLIFSMLRSFSAHGNYYDNLGYLSVTHL